MQTIDIKTGRPYSIHIGNNLLSQLPIYLAQLCGQRRPKLAFVTDDRVDSLARNGETIVDALRTSLEAAGFATCKFVFPNGEQSKTLATVESLYGFLSEQAITRTDLIVAVGGGVTGDLAGFAAATWLRGIDFVQLPTTLLAMVDSSVGGKTGVDLPQGKNLVGAFWQPSLVVCDTAMLDLLPADIFAAGMAEVIKYGAIMDAALFAQLEQADSLRGKVTLDGIISRCVDLKREVVEQDERDKGLRQILNFGHTLGHAVEKESRFTLSHGQGVAIGMALITRACEGAGLTPAGVSARIEACCAQHGLPTQSPYPPEILCPHCMGDKKRDGQRLTLIILNELGQAGLHTIDAQGLLPFLTGAHHG